MDKIKELYQQAMVALLTQADEGTEVVASWKYQTDKLPTIYTKLVVSLQPFKDEEDEDFLDE